MVCSAVISSFEVGHRQPRLKCGHVLPIFTRQSNVRKRVGATNCNQSSTSFLVSTLMNEGWNAKSESLRTDCEEDVQLRTPKCTKLHKALHIPSACLDEYCTKFAIPYSVPFANWDIFNQMRLVGLILFFITVYRSVVKT